MRQEAVFDALILSLNSVLYDTKQDYSGDMYMYKFE